MIADVLIVGSGAGAAPLALSMSRAGFEVLVLEKGPRYEHRDYQHDEVLMGAHSAFFTPPVADEPHVLIDHAKPEAEPELTTLGWTACCVGGGTEHMGGALYRFHPGDFRLRSQVGGDGAIVDWPYGYDQLEPYYARAEWEVGVSGSAAGNPFAGARSTPFPQSPVRSHPFAEFLDEACSTLGLHAFHTPFAINSRPYNGRPACAHCDFCAGYGCPTGARGSMRETLLRRAERTGRCQVRHRSMVREITVGANGRASGCVYIDTTGTEHAVEAHVVCICCSAVESARLLLNSTSPPFRDGLANGSGLVGRYLQFHTASGGSARFRYDRHPEKALRDRNPFLGRSVMDYYFLPEGVSDIAKGGLIRFDMAPMLPIATAQRLVWAGGGAPIWGHALKERLREHFQEHREVEFEIYQDFLPNDQTYVELDPVVKDRWGIPSARIHLAEPTHHVRAGRWLVDLALEILDVAGADDLLAGPTGRTTGIMVHGTCRSGTDPAASVLNPFCRAHEIPNLFVVDGSFMPTSGGAPSTLTIIANSFRTAAYIIDRARTGDL